MTARLVEKGSDRWPPGGGLTTATLLFDLPITQCIDAFLSRGEPFRYTYSTAVGEAFWAEAWRIARDRAPRPHSHDRSTR